MEKAMNHLKMQGVEQALLRTRDELKYEKRNIRADEGEWAFMIDGYHM
jgi:hypothetical protein